jgi:predicted PurR-regulated permease PerM
MAGLITLAVALAAALYLCWLMLQPFLNVLLWASVLAVVFCPMHRRIRAGLKSATAAAAASTLLALILILVPVTLLTIAVVHELRGAAASLQGSTELFSKGGTPLLAWLLDRVGQYVNVDREAARQFIAERMQLWGAALASSTLIVVGGVVGAMVQTGLVMFSMFYLFRDGEGLRHTLYGILPLQRIQSRQITIRTRDMIAATIYGVLVISAIQGTLGTVIFWILGLPSPLLWGVVMFFLSMIPMAGSFLVWVPAALYLAFTGEYVRAGILAGWGILVIGSIDNFLSPKLVGQRTRLHELLIFFAVLGGLEVFGVLGLVLGPVVVAVTLALIEMVRQAHRPPSDTSEESTVLEQQSELREAS